VHRPTVLFLWVLGVGASAIPVRAQIDFEGRRDIATIARGSGDIFAGDFNEDDCRFPSYFALTVAAIVV
jgi:hypothetical protein